VDLEQLPDMNAAIDEAARNAWRRPDQDSAAVQHQRQLRHRERVSAGHAAAVGRAAHAADGVERDERLHALVSSADALRRFAEEVAPATREQIADARGAPDQQSPTAPVVIESPTPLAARPTPEPERLSRERAWDETTRPTGPTPDPLRTYTPREQAAGQHLIDVHDALRGELAQLRDLVEQVAAGTTNPAAVRSFINRMTIRQNNWTLGTFCETYCRTVTNLHVLEDRSVFSHLRRRDAAIGPLIDRLEEEHEQIADLLERVDQALVALVAAEEDGIYRVGRAMDLMTDALLSHFSYEERELVEPLARHGFY
jgi:Hemerythrin HHE cation binding domain